MKSRGVPDFFLLLLTFLLVGFGITFVLSSSSIFAMTNFTSRGCGICGGDELFFVKKQVMWMLLGTISMLVTMNIPLSFYKRHYIKIVVVCFLALFFVLIPGIGYYYNGSRAWYRIGSTSIQPVEFSKLGLLVYIAAIIAKKGEGFRKLKTGLIPPLLVTGLFFLVIVPEPDLGSAVITVGTALVVMICGGARIGQLIVLGAPTLTLAISGYILTKKHAWDRMSSYLDPWSSPLDLGYQIIQSWIAIAHGGMTGTGFGKSVQKYLYLPEAHTDFIFSIISEELGFIGASIFLFVYMLFLLRGLHICLRVKDVFASLLGVGVISMIGIQAVINIGGATGIIPLTGVPLPFISYGGSSLLVCMMSTGILLNVSREISKQKLEDQLQKQVYSA